MEERPIEDAAAKRAVLEEAAQGKAVLGSDDHKPAGEMPGEERSTPLPEQSYKGPTEDYDAAPHKALHPTKALNPSKLCTQHGSAPHKALHPPIQPPRERPQLRPAENTGQPIDDPHKDPPEKKLTPLCTISLLAFKMFT